MSKSKEEQQVELKRLQQLADDNDLTIAQIRLTEPIATKLVENHLVPVDAIDLWSVHDTFIIEKYKDYDKFAMKTIRAYNKGRKNRAAVVVEGIRSTRAILKKHNTKNSAGTLVLDRSVCIRYIDGVHTKELTLIQLFSAMMNQQATAWYLKFKVKGADGKPNGDLDANPDWVPGLIEYKEVEFPLFKKKADEQLTALGINPVDGTKLTSEPPPEEADSTS